MDQNNKIKTLESIIREKDLLIEEKNKTIEDLTEMLSRLEKVLSTSKENNEKLFKQYQNATVSI